MQNILVCSVNLILNLQRAHNCIIFLVVVSCVWLRLDTAFMDTNLSVCLFFLNNNCYHINDTVTLINWVYYFLLWKWCHIHTSKFWLHWVINRFQIFIFFSSYMVTIFSFLSYEMISAFFNQCNIAVPYLP